MNARSNHLTPNITCLPRVASFFNLYFTNLKLSLEGEVCPKRNPTQLKNFERPNLDIVVSFRRINREMIEQLGIKLTFGGENMGESGYISCEREKNYCRDWRTERRGFQAAICYKFVAQGRKLLFCVSSCLARSIS